MDRPISNRFLSHILGLTTFTSRKLMKWKRTDDDDSFSKRAVESLVKKLKSKKGALQDLERALASPNTPSKCVTIDRSIDGRLQVSHKKVRPHVIYCRLWRWPDLQSHHELVPTDDCQHPYSHREWQQKEVCINPYHYRRVEKPVLPAVVVPKVTEFPPEREIPDVVLQKNDLSAPQNVTYEPDVFDRMSESSVDRIVSNMFPYLSSNQVNRNQLSVQNMRNGNMSLNSQNTVPNSGNVMSGNQGLVQNGQIGRPNGSVGMTNAPVGMTNGPVGMTNGPVGMSNAEAMIMQNSQGVMSNQQSMMSSHQGMMPNTQVMSSNQGAIFNGQGMMSSNQCATSTGHDMMSSDEDLISDLDAMLAENETVISDFENMLQKGQNAMQYNNQMVQNNQSMMQNNPSMMQHSQSIVQNNPSMMMQHSQSIMQNNQSMVHHSLGTMHNNQSMMHHSQGIMQTNQSMMQQTQSALQYNQSTMQNYQSMMQNKENMIPAAAYPYPSNFSGYNQANFHQSVAQNMQNPYNYSVPPSSSASYVNSKVQNMEPSIMQHQSLFSPPSATTTSNFASANPQAMVQKQVVPNQSFLHTIHYMGPRTDFQKKPAPNTTQNNNVRPSNQMYSATSNGTRSNIAASTMQNLQQNGDGQNSTKSDSPYSSSCSNNSPQDMSDIQSPGETNDSKNVSAGEQKPAPQWQQGPTQGGNNPMEITFDDQEVIPFVEQPYWANIVYYELSNRVGQAFLCSTISVTVDGYSSPIPASADRLSLGSMTNIHRTMNIENTRRHIGKGLQLHYAGGGIYAECLSEASIFVQSRISNYSHGLHVNTVCKVQPGSSMKIFDFLTFSNLITHCVHIGYAEVFELTKMCTIRISFVKGWGAQYERRDVMATPCWIEVHVYEALIWLDRVLSKMGHPSTRISSVT